MPNLGHRIARAFHHHDSHSHPPIHQTRHDATTESHPSGSRTVKVVRRVLEANDMMAARLRARFAAEKIFVLNVMSSPGSGKTTLLQQSLALLMPEVRCAVIVGDICTTIDAERLAQSGAQVVQVNTEPFGGDCHLAAHVIEKAVESLDLSGVELLIVENIGNLVCPAEFDIGEDCRVVVLSVTEGEDKPAKYPLMFRQCDALVLNKIDLLPYLEYDKAAALHSIDHIHPGMPVFEISAKTGQGMKALIAWLRNQVNRKIQSLP
jgi:hydrogenase nickel incorporation protein HypB